MSANIFVPDEGALRSLIDAIKFDADKIIINVFVLSHDDAMKVITELDAKPVITPIQRVSDSELYITPREKTWAEEFNARYPDLFTHVGAVAGYVSHNNVASSGINVGISRNNGGYSVSMYHHGKYATNELFKKTFTEFCTTNGYIPRFHKRQAFIDGKNTMTKTEENTIEVFKKFVDVVKTQQIKY